VIGLFVCVFGWLDTMMTAHHLVVSTDETGRKGGGGRGIQAATAAAADEESIYFFFFSITLTCLHAYTPKLKRRRSPAGFKECKHESFKEIKKIIEARKKHISF